MKTVPSIFEKSSTGRMGINLPTTDVPVHPLEDCIGAENVRAELPLPEVSQIDIIRHYTALSQRNYGVDSGFYPLGSCTMKYNPKINEELQNLPGFRSLHPYQSEKTSQGMLRILYDMQIFLSDIAGMDAVTLQPAAGAQGELAALMVFKKYYERIGEGNRNIVIVPDSSHGTNPATAARCGYKVVKIPSGPDGLVDLSALQKELSENVAAFMITNPNTLGLFERNAKEISQMVHNSGALLYCDGANMNAILGIHRPGDADFDAMHFNLHKTFGAPHGGGGPGSGPLAVKDFLKPYLPVPTIGFSNGKYFLDFNHPETIGRLHFFYGNIAVILKAYFYILNLGASGLKNVSENAVLNANYLLKKTSKGYRVAYGDRCMHEFVASAEQQKKDYGVRALDIAKRLMDYGFHPPTMYFPLIVQEALMIEPTETESIETLDAFADAMLEIAEEAQNNPDIVKSAPVSTAVTRVDEAAAARKLELQWEKNGE